MPAIRTKTGRFAKGASGNPSGRPKRSDVEIELLASIYQLAPEAAGVIKKILQNDSAPANIRLKCAEIIINRVCGSIAQTETNEDALSTQARDAILHALAIKAKRGDTAAAKILLEEYRAKHGTEPENELLLSLFELEKAAREQESANPYK